MVLTLKPLVLLPFGFLGSASETSGLVRIMVDEEIPQDVKNVASPIQFMEGEIVDMESISHYSSCPGKEGKCRKKIDGNKSDCPSC